MTHSIDPSYRLLGARFLRRQAKQLAEQLDATLQGGDPESVHHARVASRRIRAALQMFRGCWGRKKMKRWRKEIRRVTADLGAARDKDVQIDFLCGALSGPVDKPCVLGIVRLLSVTQCDRAAVDSQVRKAIHRIRTKGVIDEILSMAKKTLPGGEDRAIAVSAAAGQEARHAILGRLDELLAEQDSLDDPQQRRRHHAMRIAAKRLRYMMEISRPIYGKPAEEAIDASKRLQSLLGEVHDCDVWLEHLDAFAHDEAARQSRQSGGNSGRFSRLMPGIEWLKHERTQTRARVFEQLIAYWQQLKEQGLWERLVRLVEAWGPASSEPVAAAPADPATEPQSPLLYDGHDETPSDSDEPDDDALLPRGRREGNGHRARRYRVGV